MRLAAGHGSVSRADIEHLDERANALGVLVRIDEQQRVPACDRCKVPMLRYEWAKGR